MPTTDTPPGPAGATAMTAREILANDGTLAGFLASTVRIGVRPAVLAAIQKWRRRTAYVLRPGAPLADELRARRSLLEEMGNSFGSPIDVSRRIVRAFGTAWRVAATPPAARAVRPRARSVRTSPRAANAPPSDGDLSDPDGDADPVAALRALEARLERHKDSSRRSTRPMRRPGQRSSAPWMRQRLRPSSGPARVTSPPDWPTIGPRRPGPRGIPC